MRFLQAAGIPLEPQRVSGIVRGVDKYKHLCYNKHNRKLPHSAEVLPGGEPDFCGMRQLCFCCLYKLQFIERLCPKNLLS